MHYINWLIVVGYLAYVVIDGVRRAKGTNNIEGYFLAGRSLPFWAVGLSVMATQLSAVTLIGTTGQAATEGMRFLQFYFGLPLAMVILGVTLVPLLRGARVYTAYEYLERRFDARTRSLTAFLFLLSRSMSCGVIISAPAVVFSAVFGWSLTWSVALIGVPTVVYTMLGGVQAVTWADVKQMILIVLALASVVVVLLVKMPVSPDDALQIAGATGRLQVFDFSFDLNDRYTVWSGLIAGTFLMLSYFGTDQSQVQRYLAAESVPAARNSLLVSAYWKIPLQALVLLVGVLVFVYYQFQAPPLLYSPAHENAVVEARGIEYQELHDRYDEVLAARADAARRTAEMSGSAAEAAMTEFLAHEAASQMIRADALAMAKEVTGEPSNDVNFIMPRFVLDQLPIGLSGLFIAAIIAAAMSSISSELNSLSTTTVVDLYQRWMKPDASDSHYLFVSRLSTLIWGLFACVVAVYAVSLGSLIEVVNRFGSFFYGSILGVFLLAMIPKVGRKGALWALLAGPAVVALFAFEYTRSLLGLPTVAYLWLNVIGAGAVVLVGLLLQVVQRSQAKAVGN